MKHIYAIAIAVAFVLAGCSRASSELVERSVVQGEFAGQPVALQIDRQQSVETEHTISLPTGLLTAASGGWGGIIAAALGALGVGGAAAAMRGGTVAKTLQAVVRGVERLRQDPTMADTVDEAMRAEMGEVEKKQVRKLKAKQS